MSQDAVDVLPDVQHLVTEDDTPVDNLPSEKQQRLLTEPLYSSWAGPGAGRSFLAAANVGIFAQARQPAIVPDMFLSLDVEIAADWWRKEHRSYFMWEFGKPPELVLEIVSNTVGGESDDKKDKYARMGADYYVVYDPLLQVMPQVLTVFRLSARRYAHQRQARFPALQLGLTLWDGVFEERHDTWLRWTDAQGVLIPTGKERADAAAQQAAQADQRATEADQRADEERQRATEADQRADEERQRADEERQRADEADQRAERLAALLRQAGINPQ